MLFSLDVWYVFVLYCKLAKAKLIIYLNDTALMKKTMTICYLIMLAGILLCIYNVKKRVAILL